MMHYLAIFFLFFSFTVMAQSKTDEKAQAETEAQVQPQPEAQAKPKSVPRANRWEASVRICLENMRRVDSKIDEKGFTHLICACIATDYINTCAPKDTTPTDKVTKCMAKRKEKGVEIMTKCETVMPLQLKF